MGICGKGEKKQEREPLPTPYAHEELELLPTVTREVVTKQEEEDELLPNTKKVTKQKDGTIFYYYPTCPKCAKKYGKNYVVIFAKISD